MHNNSLTAIHFDIIMINMAEIKNISIPTPIIIIIITILSAQKHFDHCNHNIY